MKEIWVEKYRPKTLDEVVGQDEIVERLKAYAKEGNLPHLLFAGPAGTGKTTSAMALARDMFGESWRQNYYELNSSDERGIEPVRTKVKEIARHAPCGEFLASRSLARPGDRRGRPVQGREHDPTGGGQEADREGARGGIPPGAGGPRPPPDRVRPLGRGHRAPAAPQRVRPQRPRRIEGPIARPDRGDGLPAHGREQRANPDRSTPRPLRLDRTGPEQEMIQAASRGVHALKAAWSFGDAAIIFARASRCSGAFDARNSVAQTSAKIRLMPSFATAESRHV